MKQRGISPFWALDAVIQQHFYVQETMQDIQQHNVRPIKMEITSSSLLNTEKLLNCKGSWKCKM